ncbi:hypothetical protein VPH35_059192 [Triticum aestivum]|uniref:Uncharacterized protein n=1 Tax=Aegilops tauschii subsp. strangulata TaxID=200361 RepID=A0A453EJC6_AEGTS|nr:uncharacterized protein LOC109754122 isoform X1 [Aegilops tauschii subsp. strangulata]XP_044356217.1 uncharacterized protein LOC123077917 [Triticum aestivum]
MSVKACFGNVANALVDWDGGRDHCPWRGSSPATPTPWPGGSSKEARLQQKSLNAFQASVRRTSFQRANCHSCTLTPDACETPKTISSSTVSSPSSGSLSSAPSTEWADRNGTSTVLFRQSSLPSQCDHTLVNINRSILKLAL